MPRERATTSHSKLFDKITSIPEAFEHAKEAFANAAYVKEHGIGGWLKRMVDTSPTPKSGKYLPPTTTWFVGQGFEVIPLYILNDPDDAYKVLVEYANLSRSEVAAGRPAVVRKGSMYKASEPFLGEWSITSADIGDPQQESLNETWRDGVNKQTAADHSIDTKHIFGELFDKHSEGEVLDGQKFAEAMIQDITTFTLGIVPTAEESEELHYLLNHGMDMTTMREMMPGVMQPLIDLKQGKEWERVDARADEVVEKCIKRAKDQNGGTAPAHSFLSYIERDAQKHNPNDKTAQWQEVRSQVRTTLVAGSESTGVTLEWMGIELSQNQDQQMKVMMELRGVMEQKNLNTPEKIAKFLASSDIKDAMPNTEAWLAELGRVHGVASVVPREAGRPIQGEDGKIVNPIPLALSDGAIVPPGALIMISPYTMHKDARIHKDPLTLNPERFLDENGKFKPLTVKDGVLTFSAGPWMCKGPDVSKTAQRAILLELARRKLLIHIAPGTPTQFEENAGFVVRPANSPKFVFTK